MHEEAGDQLTEQEPFWVASSDLRRRLAVGSWMALATGALYAAGSVVVLVEGHRDGFTLADGFAWTALMPALYVVFAYSALAEEIRHQSLGRSAQCLFLATVLLRLHELGTAGVLDLFGVIVVWSAFVMGLLGAVFLPFVADAESKGESTAAPAEATKPDESVSRPGGASAAGALGAVLVGLFAVGKFVLKVAVIRGIIRFFRDLNWDVVAQCAAIFLGTVFTVWFAVAKIRLARRLGAFASLLGWFEIFRLMVLVGCGVLFVAQITDAVNRPDLNEPMRQELEAQLAHQFTLIELISDVAWTALTVCFFLTLRSRFDPSADHEGDLVLSEVKPDWD